MARRVRRITSYRSRQASSFAMVPVGDGPRRFARDEALRILRREIQRVIDARGGAGIIVVRGQGGTKVYRSRWWSSAPTEADELADMDDDTLSDFLYGLEDPEELDVYSRTEE